MRYNITARLQKMGRTQNWLLDKLNQNGFACTASQFSDFKSCRKIGPQADQILAAASNILADYEHLEGIQNEYTKVH